MLQHFIRLYEELQHHSGNWQLNWANSQDWGSTEPYSGKVNIPATHLLSILPSPRPSSAPILLPTGLSIFFSSSWLLPHGFFCLTSLKSFLFKISTPTLWISVLYSHERKVLLTQSFIMMYGIFFLWFFYGYLICFFLPHVWHLGCIWMRSHTRPIQWHSHMIQNVTVCAHAFGCLAKEAETEMLLNTLWLFFYWKVLLDFNHMSA